MPGFELSVAPVPGFATSHKGSEVQALPMHHLSFLRLPLAQAS